MYFRRTRGDKLNQHFRWSLPDRVFFACGACHILAYAFIDRYSDIDFRPIWLRPKNMKSGNHIVVKFGSLVFDYHGYSEWDKFLAHYKVRANQNIPDWSCDIIELSAETLISEQLSRSYDGLWLREPKQFLYDALPRARSYLDKYPGPRILLSVNKDSYNPELAHNKCMQSDAAEPRR